MGRPPGSTAWVLPSLVNPQLALCRPCSKHWGVNLVITTAPSRVDNRCYLEMGKPRHRETNNFFPLMIQPVSGLKPKLSGSPTPLVESVTGATGRRRVPRKEEQHDKKQGLEQASHHWRWSLQGAPGVGKMGVLAGRQG